MRLLSLLLERLSRPLLVRELNQEIARLTAQLEATRQQLAAEQTWRLAEHPDKGCAQATQAAPAPFSAILNSLEAAVSAGQRRHDNAPGS